MGIILTPVAASQINNQTLSTNFQFLVNGNDYTQYLINWSSSYRTEFGSASARFTLLNSGIFSQGGTNQINVGDTVQLIENFQGDSINYKRFYGFVNQRSNIKSDTERNITLNCLDYISYLKNWDVPDTVLEAQKVEVQNETLVPNFLPAPNQVFAQIFNFQNDSISQNPLPIINIIDLVHNVKTAQIDGFNILYDVGQLKLGAPINAATNFSVQAQDYFFYPKGLAVESILQTLLTTPDGYGNYLFGEASPQAVFNNHLVTNYQNIQGSGNFDTLTPNAQQENDVIYHTVAVACTTGQTTLTLDSVQGLPLSGFATVNGNAITWTSINQGTKTLQGIPGSGTNSLTSHPVGGVFSYEQTYNVGQVWYMRYSNIQTNLTSANFSLPVGSPAIAYVDLNLGRIILQGAIGIGSFVQCTTNYSFCTLQATGVDLNYIAFYSRTTANRYEAINQLFQYLAPNYIIRTQGDNLIWASYLYQSEIADCTLTVPRAITYLESDELYSRVKFFGTNINPTNILFSPAVNFVIPLSSYKGFATQVGLQWSNTDGNGNQVYITLLTGVGYITSDDFTPVVYINGVAIDNIIHELNAMPITVKNDVQTTTKTSSFSTKTSINYYYTLYFPTESILPTQPIYCYNEIGQNTLTISPNDPNMNYGTGTYAVPGSNQNIVIEELSTATYWVQYSTADLSINYQTATFTINSALIPDPLDVSVVASFEYYTMYTPVAGVANVINGRYDTQVQSIFYSQPPQGYQYIVLDLGSVQTIQAIDIVPGYYEPDQYNQYNINFSMSLQWSIDNTNYFDITDKTQNVQVASGTDVTLDETDLGIGFQARYLAVTLDNVSAVSGAGTTNTFTLPSGATLPSTVTGASLVNATTNSDGSTSYSITNPVWVVALTQVSAYSDIIITSNAYLIPTCIYASKASTTITVDSTQGFTVPGSTEPDATAYFGNSLGPTGTSFTYTGLTGTTFTGCILSSGSAPAAGNYIYQSLMTQADNTLYDNDLLLRRLGDRLYKQNLANNSIYYSQAQLDSLALSWLQEYYKDHTRCTVDVLYTPYLNVGMTVSVTDPYTNQVNVLYFIEAITEAETGVYTLQLARYP